MREVLYAIQRAVDVADVHVAYETARKSDPLIRGRARGVLRDALLAAETATTLRTGEYLEAHQLRLAYLFVAKAPFDRALVDDVAAIERAYVAAIASAPPSRPRWTRSLALVLSVGLVSVAAYGARALLDQRAHAAAMAAASQLAGTSDLKKLDVVTRALGSDLPAFLIALDQRTETLRSGRDAVGATQALDAAATKLLAQDLRGPLGDDGFARLTQLVEDAKDAAAAPIAPTGEDAKSDAFGKTVSALDDLFAKRGLAYFLDGDVISDLQTGKRLVLVYAFTIEGVTRFAAATGPLRALTLRRLDNLNWSQALLGFTRPGLRDALVLLDQVDEQLVTYVLPALAPDASMRLFDDDDRSGATVTLVERRAGEIVRSELGAMTELDHAEVEELGRLLERRHDAFRRMADSVRNRGLILREPGTLRLEPDLVTQLRGAVPNDLLADVISVDQKLADSSFVTSFTLVRAALVASIARHEAQHRLDYAAPDGLRMPEALAKYTGAPRRPNDLPTRARAELSAYVAQVARDDRAARTAFTLLSRFLFSRRAQGTAESYAAVVAFEVFAKELGITIATPLVGQGQIDRASASATYLELSSRSSVDLRAAATRAWSSLYGVPFPELK
jgi:hypothetical protein